MIAVTVLLSLVAPQAAPALSVRTERVSVGSRRIEARVVEADLTQFRLQIVWGGDRAGGTEALASMGRRTNAAAVINGGYFDAYSNDGRADAYHTMIVNGLPISLGSVGSVLAIDGNKAMAERGNPRVTGKGGNGNFYVYRANHTPGSSVAGVYTANWGPKLGFDASWVALNAEREVTAVGSGDGAIPRGGSLLAFRGGDASLQSRFRVGATVEFQFAYPNARDAAFLQNADLVVGCGPLLVRGGAVDCQPAAEGFTSSRVQGSSARSAIGFKNGRILFVVLTGTFQDAANVMKGLGCTEAIGLDGGASSGLWTRQGVQRSEGRRISHGIALIPR